MEKGLNSYYGMGYNDYLYAKNSINVAKEIGNYNGLASMASQSAEKLLKSIIEVYFVDDEECIKLMRSNNFRTIVDKINSRFTDRPLDSKDYKWLGDFYYDARYPGDNFIMVGEESGLECIRLLDELIEWIDSIEKPQVQRHLGLGKIKDFID